MSGNGFFGSFFPDGFFGSFFGAKGAADPNVISGSASFSISATGTLTASPATTVVDDPGRAAWEINDKNRKRLIRAMRKRDRLVQDEAEIEYLIQMGCI